MGKLYYGANGTEVTFDDRLLAHIRLVIVSKLRRDEKFMFSWEHESGRGEARCSVWLHPAIEIQFAFDSADRIALNRSWIEAMMDTANSGDGLRVIPEPAQPASAPASSSSRA